MDVQATRSWAQSHPRINAAQQKLIFAALDSFEVLYKATSISREELAAILEAARCRLVAPSCVGGLTLASLASRHPAAQDAFRDLVSSRKCGERFQGIYSLSGAMPKPLLQELLTRGLNDRSTSVRSLAASKCDTLRLREMLPEILQRAAGEPDAGVKQKLEFHAAMIRDGYLVERKEGERLSLCVRARDGWSWQEISQADIDGGRLPILVAERQSKP